MHAESLELPKHWRVYRNGNLAAAASSHLEAKSIVRQLKKLHPYSEWLVRYEGKSIPHCGDKGEPL